MFVRERFSHSYKERFVLLSNWHGISQSTLLGASIFVGTPLGVWLWCHFSSLSSPLAGIIYFGLLRIAVSLTILKCVCERCFHIILRNVSFYFSTDVRSHSPWELLKNLWKYLNRRIRIYYFKRGRGLLLILCVDIFIKYMVNFIRYD